MLSIEPKRLSTQIVLKVLSLEANPRFFNNGAEIARQKNREQHTIKNWKILIIKMKENNSTVSYIISLGTVQAKRSA
jgi:hypothetical protein